MSSNQRVLFLKEVNGGLEWSKKGDEDKDWKYVGEIGNGGPNGTGTLTSPDGRKYEGEFKDGNYHGQGSYSTPDLYFEDTGELRLEGYSYDGGFKEGVYHGKGVLKFHYGKTWEGEWKDGDAWNVIIYLIYDEEREIIKRYVDGKEQ